MDGVSALKAVMSSLVHVVMTLYNPPLWSCEFKTSRALIRIANSGYSTVGASISVGVSGIRDANTSIGYRGMGRDGRHDVNRWYTRYDAIAICVKTYAPRIAFVVDSDSMLCDWILSGDVCLI